MPIKGTEAWIAKLSTIEMPALSSVVKELTILTGDDETDINQLAEAILKDAHLTSQILRLANTIQYNPGNASVNTISRAIVLIGFSGVKAVCISLMLIESLLVKYPREQLLAAMAQAFHGAAQAKAMTAHLSNEAREEVFVAALLYNLGEMVFWAYGGSSADNLDDKMTGCLDSPQKLIEEQLGTSFKTLSQELGKAWHLGDTLQEALGGSRTVSPEVQAVRLGEAISRCPTSDWGTPKAEKLLKMIARYTQQPLSETKKMVKDATESAAIVAQEYGAAKVCHLIPSTQTGLVPPAKNTSSILTADPQLQLKILRDLVAAVSERLDVNTVFQMVLEGMHRGIGLERVLLAFFQKDQLRAKYVLGQGTAAWRKRFVFAQQPLKETIFSYGIKQQRPVWFGRSDTVNDESLYSDEVVAIMGKHPAFVGVLRINNRNAALFYADRGSSGESLSAEQFDAFSHFLMQAQMSLQAMAGQLSQ